MKINIQDSAGQPLLTVDVDASDTILSIKEQLLKNGYRRNTFTLSKTITDTPLNNSETVRELKMNDGDSLCITLNRTEFAWRTIYVGEYIMGLLGHCFTFLVVCGMKLSHPVQWASLIFFLTHYSRRISESLFVHKFSRATLPLSVMFTNFLYYGSLGGFVVAWDIYVSKSYADHSIIRWGFLIFACIAAFMNHKCHVYLSRERKGQEYFNPTKYGYTYISSVNYTYESICWLCFAVFTDSNWCYIFWATGTIIMYVWAVQKRNRRGFNQKYAMFPIPIVG